jgi:hypothetical protein
MKWKIEQGPCASGRTTWRLRRGIPQSRRGQNIDALLATRGPLSSLSQFLYNTQMSLIQRQLDYNYTFIVSMDISSCQCSRLLSLDFGMLWTRDEQ